MRRYRFGRTAAPAAIVFMALVVAAGVPAVSGRDDDLIWWLVAHVPKGQPEPYGWWYIILILAGAVQAWALWQILRGRLAGDRPAPGRYVPWLRAALYADLAGWPLSLFEAPSWTHLPFDLAHLAVVVLFFLVLDGASRALRLAVLVTGVLSAVSGLGYQVADAFGLPGLEAVTAVAGLGGVSWLLWMTLTLVAQARDGRWGRTTVWAGVVSVAAPVLLAPMSFTSYLPLDTSGAFEMIFAVSLAIRVFDQVWLARSAHDLGNPRPRAGRPEPAGPAAFAGPAGAPAARWPLPVVAVLLPVLPALANLAQAAPLYIGARGPLGSALRDLAPYLTTIWSCLDVAVGVGAPAVLVLLAVRRRTRRLVRGAALALLIAAAAGVASTAMGSVDPTNGVIIVNLGADDVFTDGLDSLYRDEPGISPLWYAAALACSALILLFLYGRGPARRRPYRPYRAVATGTAAALAVCLLAAADHAPGPITTARECHPPENVPDLVMPRRDLAPVPPLTPDQVFVCDVRDSTLLPYAGTAPDMVLLAHGRRLCGVYTRDDPAEIARVGAAEGVRVRDLTYLLSAVCPAAAAHVGAAEEEEERELLAMRAEERRVCDEAPRHRPLIRPVSQVVERDPVWTDYGVLESYETEEDYGHDAELAADLRDNGLVAARPGRLTIDVFADAPVCVTTETYTRRPPVETRGWDRVVEVGYLSPEGDLTLSDPMYQGSLPNLAVRGKGHYRVRVHYDVLPGEGGAFGGQRLLVMAYPGPGDRVVVHRKQ